jgi:hypothetical protein
VIVWRRMPAPYRLPVRPLGHAVWCAGTVDEETYVTGTTSPSPPIR